MLRVFASSRPRFISGCTRATLADQGWARQATCWNHRLQVVLDEYIAVSTKVALAALARCWLAEEILARVLHLLANGQFLCASSYN